MALVQCLATVYDEAQQVSADGRAAHPQVPWQKLEAMGELMSEPTLDFDAIWQTIRDEFPPLINSLNTEAQRHGEEKR